MTDLQVIPGFKRDQRRSYVYVQAGDCLSFRKFFADIRIVPGAPRPKSGSIMNDEMQLITPAGEVYCVIGTTGDHDAWVQIVEEYSKSVHVKTARVQDQSLVISDGASIPLELCRLESSDGR